MNDTLRRLQAIIDTAIDGIITIDNKGIVESINPAGAHTFGYEPEEIIGHNINILMPSPDRERHDTYISSYISSRNAKIIGIGREVHGLKKNGSVFPFRLAVGEVILNDRTIFTGIIHDLSDVKAAEKKIIEINRSLERKVQERTDELEKVVNRLLSTNQQLETEVTEREAIAKQLTIKGQELQVALGKERELSELKSRFVSMASHEFRTPLSTILSSAALISRYPTEDQFAQREKHVGRIKSAVTNLTGILNDFLSLSKLEEGKISVKIQDCRLEEICQEVMQETEGILKKDQKIEYSGVAKDIIFRTDARILKNIFFNLVSNAIKYSDAGSVISCDFQSEDDHVIISIADEGIGIPIEDQKHLFSRFFRASNVESIQGTGLGLNIVRKYVKLLGGEISYTSTIGLGTTFIVKLPKLTHPDLDQSTEDLPS